MHFMKSLAKLLLAAVLLAGAGHAVANSHAVANVRAAEIQDRHITGFNGVNVAGSFDVIITQGPNESVKVEAPADVIDRIKTDVEDGVLKIYNKHDTFNWGDWWGHHKKIVVYVTARDLNSINISGSGDVNFKDGIKTVSLKLRISGSGDMNGRLEVKNLESSISGSGDMKLSGRAETSSVSLVGSGDYTAHGLLTAVTSVRVSGSGDAEINVSERLDASVNGSGDVHYSGGPKSVNKHKSGSGDISGS
jgi:nucleoside-specific outer membrane channel protein Tsx